MSMLFDERELAFLYTAASDPHRQHRERKDVMRTRSVARFCVVVATVSVIGSACQNTTTVTARDTSAGTNSKFATPQEIFSPANFRSRRERLTKLVPDGLVVLIGAKGVIDAWEEHRNDPTYRVQPVRQEENLFYLTGVTIPNAAV